MRFYDKDIMAARPNLAFMPFESHHRRKPSPRTNFCAASGVLIGRIRNFVETRTDLVRVQYVRFTRLG
jgi:hypothetical protein